MIKKDLKPVSVFRFFQEINGIPRPSKHEERMIAYLEKFGKDRGLETVTDEIGNVLIRKNASKGYEGSPTIILQSHIDMVCDKVAEHKIDFLNDPIEAYTDGEWMRANGTTLGADDGIGCAIELALLDDDTIEHGPIECLFTRDEETGLTGANGLRAGFLKGSMLLNLDSEDEGLFYVSCAGGKTTTAKFRYTPEDAPKDCFFMQASVKGLTGGHSGDDINKKRANAIKLLARFLYLEQRKMPVRLAQFNAGKLHNAITREGSIVFAVPFGEKETVRVDWNIFCSDVEEEFQVTEKSIVWHMESTDRQMVMPKECGERIITALQAVHNGVFSVCQDDALGGMTETSSNTAVISTAVADKESNQGECRIVCSQRSNVMSNLTNMVNTVRAVFELAGADDITHSDGYPAWTMNPESKLRAVAEKCYKELFGNAPKITGIHAGLECGLFAQKYPYLDMLSIGPTMRGVHSPDERLHIPSVEKVWRLVLGILKEV